VPITADTEATAPHPRGATARHGGWCA